MPANPEGGSSRKGKILLAIAAGVTVLVALVKLTMDANAPLPTSAPPESAISAPVGVHKDKKPAPRPSEAAPSSGGEILSG